MRYWNQSLWLKLSPLLDGALDLAPEDRPAYVATLRAQDDELASAVEMLLAEHDRVIASGFLESPPVVEAAPTSLAGQTIGAYTLERPLGIGGMGTVWRARRSDGRFEGRVALKFVNFAVLDHVGQDRFKREGTLLARLSHPHIARLLDAGVTAGGQPFLVLEYVEGQPIDRYANEHRLTVDARLGLFLQIADAVAHAHANLIVHRDLKPSNVLVDTTGQVKLLDFGVATLLDAGSPDRPPTITAGGITPEYAAPEQASGGAVTTATDVYALGVLLYELLVGRHPTAPDNASHVAALRAIAEREPPRPSDVAGHLLPATPEGARILGDRATTRERLQRTCRGDLDTIVGKALKKAPAERYQTVTALAEDVRHHLRHEPVTARPHTVRYRMRMFAARHRLEMGAAAAIALALVGGTAIAVRQARASARERDRALEQLRRAEATNEFSAFLLAEARPAASGPPISNKELLARGEALINRRFATDAALRVHMLLTLADRYQENQQFQDWRRVLKRALDEAATIDDPTIAARAACAWAHQFSENGDARRALDIVTRARAGLSSSPERLDVESRCFVVESSAARAAGDARRAIEAAQAAVAIERRRGASGRMFEALAALASSYNLASRYSAGDGTYRQAIALLDSEGLGTSLDAAMTLNNWSAMLQDAGRYVQAVDPASRAVMTARAIDTEHGASLSMLSTYANALSTTGDHAQALKAFDESLAKARAAGSARRLINALYLAVIDATDAGDVDRAASLVAEAERVLDVDRSAYSRGLVEASAARLALARHDLDGAVRMSERAVATLDSATPNKTSLRPTLTLLADALNARGRFREALAVAERSLQMARDRLGDQQFSFGMGQALFEVAVAKDGLGDAASASEAATAALAHLRATGGPDASWTRRADARVAAR